MVLQTDGTITHYAA